MRDFGYKESIMDGTELIYGASPEIKIPEKCSYIKYLPKVIDQGYNPICVPCSISAYINWNINMQDGENKRDNKVNLFEIYASRTNDGDNGMSFKDALRFMRHNGVKTDAGVQKIRRYAKVGGIEQLKNALVSNGPCLGALPVWNLKDEFWNAKWNDNYQGGHAISIVGYDKKGFIIRNSWGASYGEDGYSTIDYSDFNLFFEVWTII